MDYRTPARSHARTFYGSPPRVRFPFLRAKQGGQSLNLTVHAENGPSKVEIDDGGDLEKGGKRCCWFVSRGMR